MSHTLKLHKVNDTAFRAQNPHFDSGEMPLDKLHLLASAYSGFKGDLKVQADSEDLAIRFTQLVQRYTTNEYLGVPGPILNHLTNIADIDRYDFQPNKQTGTESSVIILGAGPTLERDVQKAFDSGHFVIACGSAICYLARKGFKPDAALALDPNEVEVKRFQDLPKEWHDVPLIYKGRLAPDALALWPGPKIWVPGTGWQGAATWEGADEAFPGGGIGVSTWSLEICRYIGFKQIYWIGFDFGHSEDNKLYNDALADCEHAEDEKYQEYRRRTFIDEQRTLSDVIKTTGLNVSTLSTVIEGVSQISEIPVAQDKWQLKKEKFGRTYWRRVRRGVKEMLASIEKIERKKDTTINELENTAIAKYLLQPQIHVAANKHHVLGLMNITAFLETCQAVKPLLKRI